MTLRLLQLRRSPVHLNRVFSVVSKSTDRFISVAYLTRPLFDCLHFIVSLFVPSFTNGDRFYFYLFLVCVSIRKRVYIINGGLVLSVFLEPFLVGFWCCVPTGGAVLNLLFASSGTAAMGICSCEEQPFTVGPSTLREMPDNLATSVYV